MHHLVGVAEVAGILSVSNERVRQISETYLDFPYPIAELKSGRIWAREDIQEWLKRHSDRGTDVVARSKQSCPCWEVPCENIAGPRV